MKQWNSCYCIVFLPQLRTKRHRLEDLHTEGWVTLKQIFKKHDGGQGLDWSASEERHVAGNSEYAELLGLVKCAELVD